MKNIIMILISIWAFSGCSSLRVNVDYDPGFDFKKTESFSVAHQSREGENTLFSDRVIKALEADLASKGYERKSKEEADLLFVFHANVEQKIDIDTDYQMVGFAGYGYGPGMVATTHTRRYTQGTLIIDALNPKDQKIVWRGVATDILNEKKTPQERTEYLNKVVTEAMKSFPGKSRVDD